ncbi:MAG: GWxTD domain-containing protein [Rhodothermales bacterium]|nr:GWxTD domain-containing protein [Rhodothermales bacterium]MBO6780158.1 GWxTD domain-containing protein [Rhodothermales bacterium]
MARILSALLLASALTASASAQELPIQLDLDHASFAYDESSSMIELYLAFEAATLPFNQHEQGFLAVLPVDLKVQRASDALLPGTPAEAVWADSLDLSFMIADTTSLQQGQQFLHQVRAAVPPGEYELQVSIPGEQARPAMMLRRDVVVPNFSDSEFVELSDLTLASEVRRADSRDEAFYKNGLVVKPNANQLFGAGLSQLYYYGEAYNLERLSTQSDEYTVFAYIAEANLPQPIEGLQRRSTRPLRDPDVLIGSFNLATLPSGSYFLRVALLNAENESIVERSRKFFVYNPHIEQVVTTGLEADFETSQYATMSLEEVDKMYEHITPIATDTERSRMRSIEDLEERRRFLMQFWQMRDPNTNTPINEFQEEFYQRLQFANDRYTSSFDEGWKTDRGRALLKYGRPTNIEPHLFDRGFRPYEIWQYNNIPGEGQAIFVFADRDGYGFFELLHSTVSGERKLANWQNEIREGSN